MGIVLIITFVVSIAILSINCYVKFSTKKQIISEDDCSKLQDIDCIIGLETGI